MLGLGLGLGLSGSKLGLGLLGLGLGLVLILYRDHTDLYHQKDTYHHHRRWVRRLNIQVQRTHTYQTFRYRPTTFQYTHACIFVEKSKTINIEKAHG